MNKNCDKICSLIMKVSVVSLHAKITCSAVCFSSPHSHASASDTPIWCSLLLYGPCSVRAWTNAVVDLKFLSFRRACTVGMRRCNSLLFLHSTHLAFHSSSSFLSGSSAQSARPLGISFPLFPLIHKITIRMFTNCKTRITSVTALSRIAHTTHLHISLCLHHFSPTYNTLTL